MRKKAIIAKNLELFEQIELLRADLAVKNHKIKELEDKIKELSDKPVVENKTINLPLKKLEEKVMSNSRLSPDIEYASEVIGKLVLESASGSNTLTANGNVANRELVNLLLGKTEVAKAEILSIISENMDFEDKKIRIDSVADDALDYFKSILAQIN